MVQCPHPLLVLSQEAAPFCSDVRGSKVRRRAQMAVKGAEGFGIAGREATLVLRASWFNRSPCICAKEIAAIRVYDYRAFTSRISGF
ncbi:hypothetical protein GW17_00034097 [Ensete ventricosum]|nr:hypothetical protein GW17_00034097 [Ensete ventricosum]